MQPFSTCRGVIAVLDRANVDTDQIIPKQFLKSIRRSGFGEHLFHDWRTLDDGSPNPDFPLNRERYQNARLLVTRNNFGCGSSREHAVWAVMQAGFRCVIAPTREQDGDGAIPAFADIFRTNAEKNGLLPVELSEPEVDEIFEWVERIPGLEGTVDLDEQRVVIHTDEEVAFHFEMDATVKDNLLHGRDEIGLTLKHADAIAAFEVDHLPRPAATPQSFLRNESES